MKHIQDFDVENITIKLQLDKAIYEELSRSQDPSRHCALESSKRSHKGQHQHWLKF